MAEQPGSDRALRIVVVIGTRPEAIKLCPVVQALRRLAGSQVVVVSTGQHKEMLRPILSHFHVRPDFDLDLMSQNQRLSVLMGRALEKLEELFVSIQPDAVVVQGDTTTALSSALAAFHSRIPVAHVEAGLRTHDLAAPFPEEANRALIGRVADFHYAPTDKAVAALKAECVPGEIVRTGNTVVDAMIHTEALLDEPRTRLPRGRMVLVTGHRRENLGPRFEEIFRAIALLADSYPDVDFVYPVHMNPHVRERAYLALSGRANVQLLPPVPYPEFLALLKRAYLVLTDSGGVQEEAPSFGVPVLIMRDKTERTEAVDCGCAQLVGTKCEVIFNRAAELLDNPRLRASIAATANPFGDGTASERIALHLRDAILARRGIREPALADRSQPLLERAADL